MNVEECAKTQVRQILPDTMKQVRNCDEIIDENDFCRCARNIEYWLCLFKRNELIAYEFIDRQVSI